MPDTTSLFYVSYGLSWHDLLLTECLSSPPVVKERIRPGSYVRHQADPYHPPLQLTINRHLGRQIHHLLHYRVFLLSLHHGLLRSSPTQWRGSCPPQIQLHRLHIQPPLMKGFVKSRTSRMRSPVARKMSLQHLPPVKLLFQVQNSRRSIA